MRMPGGIARPRGNPTVSRRGFAAATESYLVVPIGTLIPAAVLSREAPA
jgi:hypothetical protein